MLVGDAGHKKDPCTAQGITDAFIDADECTGVIDQVLREEISFTEGFAAWHAARDARLIPLHEMTVQMAKFEAPTPAETALYHALAHKPEATTEFLGLISGSTNPQAFFAPENISAILAS